MCIVTITRIIRIYSELIFILIAKFFIKHNEINWIYFVTIKACTMKLTQYLYFNIFLLLLLNDSLDGMELLFPMMLI